MVLSLLCRELRLLCTAVCLKYPILNIIEKFDKTPQAKEKGSINLNFRDKTPYFSQKSAQPCQVHQN